MHRYRTTGIDGLAGDENPFFACSLWLVEQYARSGRVADARALLDRVCALAGDVGVLAEEYDVSARRHAGNTPRRSRISRSCGRPTPSTPPAAERPRATTADSLRARGDGPCLLYTSDAADE